jgi:hypothetical protein
MSDPFDIVKKFNVRQLYLDSLYLYLSILYRHEIQLILLKSIHLSFQPIIKQEFSIILCIHILYSFFQQELYCGNIILLCIAYEHIRDCTF